MSEFLLAAASSITKTIRFLSGKLLLLFRAGKKGRLSHSEALLGQAQAYNPAAWFLLK